MSAGESERPTTTIAVGPLKLTGLAAQVALLVIVVGIGALLFHYRARVLSTPLTISATLWVAFVVYWSAAAANSARTVQRESSGSRAVHAWLMNVALLLLFIPLPLMDWRVLPASPVFVPVGLAVHVLSFALAIAARRALGRNWSGEISQKADHELVRSGPYRFVRHPIYSAMLGMFLGTALVSADVHAFAGVALLVGEYVRKIRLEEQNLADAFGSRYDEYRRGTRALIPWVY